MNKISFGAGISCHTYWKKPGLLFWILLLGLIPHKATTFSVTVTPCHPYYEHTTLAPHEHSIKESLSRSPTITLTGNSTSGSLQQLSFYGLPSSGSGVLYEGLLLNTQNHGGLNLSSLESFPVCRIHFKTLDPHPFYQGAGLLELQGLDLNRPHAQHVGVEGSTLSSATATASSIYTVGRVRLGVFASGTLDEGLPQYGPQRQRGELNSYKTGAFGIKSSTALSDAWTLMLLAHHKDNHLKHDGVLLTPEPENSTHQTVDLGLIKLSYAGISPFSHGLTLGGFEEKNIYNPSRFENRFQSLQVGHQTAYKTSTSTTTGHIHFTQDSYIQDRRQTQTHLRVFLSHQRSLSLTTSGTIGMLLEKVSAQRVTASPQLTLLHDLQPDLSFQLSYKHTQRFPTLLEIHGIQGIQRANPNLKPEKGHMLKGSLTWTPNKWTHRFSVFYTHLKDAISARTLGPGLYQKFNASLGTYGIIFSTHFQGDPLSGGFDYTLTLPHKKSAPSLSTGLIRHKAHAYLEHTLAENLILKNGLQIYGGRSSQRFTGGRPIPARLKPYTLLKSTLTYAPSDSLTLYVEGRNLLNQHYTLVPDYQTPRRSIHVGIHGRF